MTDLAQDHTTSLPSLEYGTVLRATAEEYRVGTSWGEIACRRAAGCLLQPAPGDTVLVAREDGVVGFATVEREGGAYAQSGTRGLVTNLYVRPACRGEGVGSELLAAAEDRLRELGVDTVALEVMAANEGARRFYRRAGYEPHRLTLEKPVESDTHSKGDE